MSVVWFLAGMVAGCGLVLALTLTGLILLVRFAGAPQEEAVPDEQD
jgi:hypothetical protein